MATFVVNAALAALPSLSPGAAACVVLQSPSGPGGDSNFVIDCRPAKSDARPSMRGRTLQLVNNGTAFTSITSLSTSLDGVNYEPLKTIEPATIGANTTEATAAVPATTTGTLTVYVCGHDFNFLKISTTVGDATSGFAVLVGG